VDLAAENAALKTRVAELEQQLTKLTDQLATLREELSRNSTNSNLPPSSDGPGKSRNQRKAERRERKGKKRGGQKGHKGSHRELLPPEQVAEFVDLYPGRCASCWESLPKIFDALPKRHQCTELEPGGARTTEYRRHAVVCPGCGHKTRADFDDDVIPRYAFGPKLMSAVVLLTGVYHLSRRRAVGVLRDLLGVRISLGAVSAIEKRLSDAVEPAVDEAWAKARSAEVKHTDGTTWLRAGVMVSLWTIATAAATVFKVVDNGRKETLSALFEVQRGVLVSDRATALKFWDMKRRQVCWAHLLRKFISFSERDGPGRGDRPRARRVHGHRFRLLASVPGRRGEPRRASAAHRTGPSSPRSGASPRREREDSSRVGLVRRHPRAPAGAVDVRRTARRRADEQPRRARTPRVRDLRIIVHHLVKCPESPGFDHRDGSDTGPCGLSDVGRESPGPRGGRGRWRGSATERPS